MRDHVCVMPGVDSSSFPLSSTIWLWRVVQSCGNRLLSVWSYNFEREDNAIKQVLRIGRHAGLMQHEQFGKITVGHASVVHVVNGVAAEYTSRGSGEARSQ